ncbi:inositol monophosphatase [Neiella sp. HB171785]|uniref:Inositol monophosphatase n=1 Tax=Neiella litorisoli TaxID=2771431 RepID=A0A8J6QKF1_9GAMM|nr:inositol monophosphatase family protein [Neiella litorisoli]MBD1390953.1 inositol monophosphatase [Neiella litorisoli]
MMNRQQLQQLMTVATDAAYQAGQYIANVDRRSIAVMTKAEGYSAASQVVTQVDLTCEAMILKALQPSMAAFDIAFLGEESASDYAIAEHPRLSKPYFWCVDPLDGTLPFTENVPGYAVSIALVSRNGEPLLGVVYDPVSATLYQGMNPAVALGEPALLLRQRKTWRLAKEQAQQPLSVFFDRSFTAQDEFPAIKGAMSDIAAALGYAGIKCFDQAGSVMNAVNMLERAPACYFKFPRAKPGGGSLWDVAATAALASAGGAWVSDMDGQPLQLNASDTLLMNRRGALYASNEAIARQVMLVYQQHRQSAAK